MAEKDELVENFKLLTTDTYTEEWVKGVWENYFTDYGDINLPLDPETLCEALGCLSTALDGFVGNSSEEGLWTVLGEHEISIKAIIALLGYLMSDGHKKKDTSVQQRELGIIATQVYLKLLMVPNTGAFVIFHPVPFEHGVDFLKFFTSTGGKPSKAKKRSGNKKSRSKSNRKSGRRSNESTLDDDEEDDAEKSTQDISRLRHNLYALLQDVVTLLGTTSLKSESSSACHVIQILAKLTQVEVDTFNGDFTISIRQDRMSVPALAYKGLEYLCTPLHFVKNTLISVTCKYLLPNLLMLSGDGVQTTNKITHTIQDQATAFICYLVEVTGSRCLASVRILVQHMCTKVPDKVEYRNSALQAVTTILRALPIDNYNSLIHWIDKLSEHKETSNRGFAVELVSALLARPQRQQEVATTTTAPPGQAPILPHRSLIRTLVDSCSDISPSVRTRAITAFAKCLISVDEQLTGALREVVTPAIPDRAPGPVRLIKTPGGPEAVQELLSEEASVRSDVTIAQQTVEGSTTVAMETGHSDGQPKKGETPLNRIYLTPGFNPNLTDSEGIFSMLRRRARDNNVYVRKAALHALECATIFESHNYTQQNVEVLKEHCRDPGLSTRKQAMQSLTELLTSRINDTFIQEKWLLGVLPLVMDREQTLSDKCMELLDDLLLKNIVPYHRSKAEPHQLAWSLLAIISQPESDAHRHYLLKACQHWGRSGKIKPSTISAVESHVGTDNNTSALMLLAEMIQSYSKLSPGFIQQCWSNTQDNGSSHDILRVMKIMSYAAKHIDAEELETLKTDLTTQLLNYKCSPNLIPTALSTLSKLCEVHTQKQGLQKTASWDWCNQLLASTDKYLSSVILEEPEAPKDEDLVIGHLTTLGEVAQLCPGKVTRRAQTLVLSIIAKPCITGMPSSQQTGTDQNDNLSDSTESSQSSQGSQQTQSTQPISQFRGSSWSSRVKAFAFTTLGKMCLQNERLTKKCVPALARELETSSDPVIRNNVLMVMCDLCVRYTTTANQYVGTIASCLKDTSALVRQQALTMITRLLQQDFLKWKGALFYRYIATVVDEEEHIATFAKTCLMNLLIKPNPNLFFQHFTECFFHFNDYRKHRTFNTFPQTDRDRELFALKGDKNAKKRLELYKFLLQNMVDEHKFKLQRKMVQEILNAMVEGVLPLNEDTKPILKDALVILGSKEIKLTVLRSVAVEEPDMNIQEKAIHIAKKSIITQVVKKNMMEEVIPIVVDLKQTLDKLRSPLLKEVVLYLIELNKDYKKEIQEVADHQLLTEIEFDLRKFEEQQQQEAQQQNVTPVIQGSPVATSPGAGQRHEPNLPAVRTPNRNAPATPPLAYRSPAHALGARKPCTPQRKPPQSITKAAILNWASMRAHGGTPKVPMATIVQSPDTRTDESSNNSGENVSEATPKDSRHLYRAISTPSAAMTDITFHGDGNMTFLPPSPIPETVPVQRMYDESSCRLSTESEQSKKPLVICIDMPAEALSPAKVVTRISPKIGSEKENEKLPEEDSLPLADKQPTAANQRRVSTRLSLSTDSPHPKGQSKDNNTPKTKAKAGRKRKR